MYFLIEYLEYSVENIAANGSSLHIVLTLYCININLHVVLLKVKEIVEEESYYFYKVLFVIIHNGVYNPSSILLFPNVIQVLFCL